MTEPDTSKRDAREQHLVAAALAVIAVYFLPYLLRGENSTVMVHDNLDCAVVWVKILLQNDLLFPHPSTHIEQVFTGVPASIVFPFYDFSLLLFNSLGMFWGYVANKVLMSLIGFAGMYLLLKKHVLPENVSSLITTGTALLFSLLPFQSFQASVSGLPMVLYAFLNIRKMNIRPRNWLIIVSFAFYSSLMLSGFFLLVVLGLILLYDVIKNRKLNPYYLAALLALPLAYMISHFPGIFSMLAADDYVSHRKEFYAAGQGFRTCLKESYTLFTRGQYHAHSLHFGLLIPILAAPFLGLFYPRRSRSRLTKIFFFLLCFIAATSLFYGFTVHTLVMPWMRHVTDMVPLQLRRFHFLHPMMWYMLLAISLFWIHSRAKFGQYIVMAIMAIHLLVISSHHELLENKESPGFKEFYDEELFSDIEAKIGVPKNTYRIISVGFHPSIAQYNGFHTLDGYFTNYSLDYKHEFREIIEGELDRDEGLKKYFDNWGSRCYAFSSELGKDYLNNTPKSIDQLRFNFDKLQSMGCRFVFSSAQINTKNISRLSHLLSVKGEYWNVHVYEILDKPAVQHIGST